MSPGDSLTAPLNPPRRLLMGPGPSNVHPRVYRALATEVVGHLDPEFLALMDRLQDRLRAVFRTANSMTLSVSGTGSAGIEAALMNVVEPDEEYLVGVNGVFGGRIAEVIRRAGATPHLIERPWGETIDPDDVRQALEAHPEVRGLCLVHAETSTGAHQPLEEIGRLLRERDLLFIVDTVTSLGGVELRVDDWGIDVASSGTQKCLSCPPGLAPLTLSDRAMAKLRSRETPVRSWYLDLRLIDGYWAETKRAYHHTAPISMNYALHEALGLVLEEGLEARIARHRLHSRALVAGLEAMGLEMAIPDASRRLPVLNPVRVPGGIDEARVRRELLEHFNIEIGAGLGALAGKIWRIGLMGESSRREHVTFFLGALGAVLASIDPGGSYSGGVAAANAVYPEA